MCKWLSNVCQIILAPLKSQAIQSLCVYFIASLCGRTLRLFNRSFSVLVQNPTLRGQNVLLCTQGRAWRKNHHKLLQSSLQQECHRKDNLVPTTQLKLNRLLQVWQPYKVIRNWKTTHAELQQNSQLEKSNSTSNFSQTPSKLFPLDPHGLKLQRQRFASSFKSRAPNELT